MRTKKKNRQFPVAGFCRKFPTATDREWLTLELGTVLGLALVADEKVQPRHSADDAHNTVMAPPCPIVAASARLNTAPC